MNTRLWSIDIADEPATERLAGQLTALLGARALITLDGSLGAGKTRFVRALAAATGVDARDVTSPTFTLLHEYQGSRTIFHLDAYRVRGDQEFLDLGIDELLASDGWTLIEWASRVARCLPDERLAIRIEPTGETARRFTFVGQGDDYARLVERLAAICSSSGTSR